MSPTLRFDQMDLDFWLDKPLKIAVIIVLAVVLNFIIRLIVRNFAEHIARGDVAPLEGERKKPGILRAAGQTRDWLLQESPIAMARRAQRAKTVGSVLRSVTTIVVSVIAILMVLTELGFNLAPVLTGAGIVGVALGFGAQTLVKDYLSGLFLVAEDQFGIGDVVDLGEAGGTVEAVGLRVTQVRSVDGTLWHVRNGEILRVGNQSQGWARAVMDIPIPYDSDVRQVSDLVLQCAKDMLAEDEWSNIILEEPEVWGVEAFTGESITLRLVIKTKPLEQWAVAREMRARLKLAMDRNGIHIPLLQQTVIRTGNPGVFDPTNPQHHDESKDHKERNDRAE
ncbi:mechanosensitive ion channel family protein [Saxibacter everestensis]|uniref:Mechanosensitive ion channel family protein n=1 Tax=Saxibacter everestensis TaxID=2909229 RepID=A0ABY8QQ10_9MICO|nr:mechanosensitive ion channel family protein [Brevibacteriaceae bacterium ZFBP1038]